MSRLSTLKDKIRYRIKKSKESVFLVKDFTDLSGRPQVQRALKELLQDDFLLRVGAGIYAKSRKSSIADEYVPQKGLRAVAMVAMKKLGVKVLPTPAEVAYNSRQSTQVPNGFIIGVNKRVSRNITFNKARIRYEVVV